jgi:alkaline phosphatase D
MFPAKSVLHGLAARTPGFKMETVMRHLLVLGSLMGLAACQPETGSVVAAGEPPTSVVDALAPYYAALDVERPQAPVGLGEPADDAVLTEIMLGSCHRGDWDLAILDQISSESPDLFIYAGDIVYGDAYSWDSTLPELRHAYADLAAAEEFGRMRAAMPMLATWDDHDYGMNDFGENFPFKGFAEELFLEFWRIPADDVRRSRPGVYDSRIYGPEGQRVQIILLDTRYFRGALTRTDEHGAAGRERYIPTENRDVSMLGDVQWDWLASELSKPADVRLIVSSIQVHADGHGWEAWRTMPHERDRFYRTIAESGAEGVVLLSGDRHSSGLYVRDDVIGYPLYELTSSSLNMSFATENNEPGPYRIGEMYAPINYGAVLIDWETTTLSLEIRDAGGVAVREIGINLDNLTNR